MTRSICICKRGISQSGATIGRGYSPPPVGLNSWKGKGGPYSSARALLLRAMVAAEKGQSPSGLVAVAKAFAALGEDKAASMVLSLVGKNWVEETNDSPDIVSPACWDK